MKSLNFRYVNSPLLYRLNTNANKISTVRQTVELDKLILKYIQNFMRSRIDKTFLKNKVGGLDLIDITTFFKTQINKKEWY